MPRLGAIQGDQQAVGDFVSVTAATLPAEHFFAPGDVERLDAAPGPLDQAAV